MKDVLVLMSSFNGDRYLEEQLESLFQQKDVNVKILVRDDGSTDQTQEILKKYEKKRMLNWYAGQNIGWRKSFMHLALNAPDCEYYAFCDQDDVWLPNKLSAAIAELEKKDESRMLLYFSNLIFWRNGEKKGLIKPAHLKYSRCSCAYQNQAVGCTIVFNRKLLEFVKRRPFENVYAHDFWFFQTAVFFGNVVYDSNAYILYRQHERNQLGAKKGFFSAWNRRFHNFFKKETISRSQNAENFLNIYKKDLSSEDYKIFGKVANYQKSIKNKLTLLFSRKYTMNSMTNSFLLKIRILFNRF